MTKAEVQTAIKKEFMERYEQWMIDRFDLNDHDYGWKYGWCKSENLMNLKDSIKAVTIFQKYIFSGKYMQTWEKEGYTRHELWELVRDGWLSEDYSCSSKAIREGKTNFIYLSQRVAKEVWREARGK